MEDRERGIDESIEKGVVGEMVEMVIEKIEKTIEDGGCGCQSEYCPFDKAVSLSKEFNIPIKNLVELMVFSEIRALQASGLLATGSILVGYGLEDWLIGAIKEAKKKLLVAMQELAKPGRVAKRKVRPSVEAALWTLEEALEDQGVNEDPEDV